MSTGMTSAQMFSEAMPGLLVALLLVTLPLVGLAHVLLWRRLGARARGLEGGLALGCGAFALGAYAHGMRNPDAPEPFLMSAVFLAFPLSWGAAFALASWTVRRPGARTP